MGGYVLSFLVFVIVFADFLCHIKGSCVSDDDSLEHDYVSFRNRSLHTFPSNIPIGARHLDLGRNFISSLPNGSLQRFPYLTCLDLSFNSLTFLDQGIYANMTSLVVLTLTGNGITAVHPGAFDGTEHLEELNLSENDLSMFDFSTLSSMSISLKSLDLSRNKIESFANNSVTFLSLEHVNLDRNRLNILEHGWLPKLPSVKILELQENIITHITDDIFFGLNSLRTLDLAGNQLGLLTNSSCSGLGDLDELRLSYNQFTTMPSSCFTVTKNVTKLYLNGNKFETVPQRSFQSLVNLHHLDISDSAELRAFESAAFAMLENLVELRLANNDHVTEIDTSVWGSTPMTKLKVLKLDSNALLRSVPEALVDGLPQLEEVSLQNLSLKCDCNLRWIREWAELRDYVTFHLTNSECVNALSPGLTPVTDVKTEEMVCEAPYVVTSSVNSGHLPDFAQLKVTISNVGLPVVTWELPNGDIFGLGTHRPSTNDTVSAYNQTLVIINTTAVSTVLVCTLNISNITTNFYGQYVMTATNMAGNVTQSLVLEEVSPDVNLADLPRVQLTVSLVSVVAVVFLLGMICFINLHHTNEQRFQRLSAEKSNDNNSTEDAQQGNDSMSDVEAVIENLDSRTFLQKEKAVATIAGEHNNPGFEQDDEFTRL